MGELIPGKTKQEEALQCTLVKFAGDTKLKGTADTLEGKAAIQTDLPLLKERTKRNFMNFSKDKCKFQHIRTSPLQ